MYKTTSLMATVAAVTFSAAISSAPAAEQQVAAIARITGSVMVNKGPQYVGGTEGMPLSIGERVMTLEGTSAEIQFDDGCRYTMDENEIVTIPRLSPCVMTKGPSGRLSVAPPVPPTSPTVVPVVPIVPVVPYLGWVPVAAVAAVGAFGAAFDTGDPDRPAISQ
jgi:hypothetical protein